MPLLALVVWFSAGKNFTNARNLVIGGLLFSTAGDTLLMFADRHNDLFVFGLITFLIAHICYILAFNNISSFKQGFIKRHLLLTIPFLLYWLLFNGYLFDSLPASLKIPVIIYSMIIMVMALSALNLREAIAQRAFLFIFVGALFFLLSDSILAIGKFTLGETADFNLSIFIMTTYILGQFGIAYGVVKVTQTNFN